MFNPKCRLCSSTCDLISLFNGKSRRNRDYIRKLAEITTGIKFEKDDAFKCICYPCTVQVYNFYIFKTRSTENERILEAHIKKDVKPESKKFQIFNLRTIPPPEISELQNRLIPWLKSKQNYCSLASNEYDENTSSDVGYNNVTNSVPRTVESGIQCDKFQNCDFKDTVHNSTQTDLPSLSKFVQCVVSSTESSTQCDNVQNCDFLKNTVHNSTQTDRSNSVSLSKYVQCVISSTVKHTQTNRILVKSRKVQCCLQNDKQKTTNCDQDSETQPKLKSCEKATQFNENCEDNFNEPDYKCALANVKQPLSPLPEPSTINHFFKSLSLSPVKNNVPSPVRSLPSPTILFSPNKKSENVVICKHCNQCLNSKLDYKLHKKTHMVCKFCKRKFLSMKRTRWHVQEECNIKKMLERQPTVGLVKLELLSMAKEKYSKYVEDWKNAQQSTRGVRMRSRSTSSVESVYSCCSLCRSPVSILHGLKLGVDKAVQTGLLFENSTVVNRNVITISKFRKSEGLVSSPKRIKLSHSFTK